MKILHLTSYYMEGFGYQENWLPYHQKELGNSVVILTSDRWFPLPNYEKSIEPIHGGRIRQPGIYEEKGLKIIKKKAYFEVPSRAVTLFRYYRELREFDPDVIHIHGATNFNIFPALFFAITRSRTLVVDCHQDFLVTRYNSLANRINYGFWKILYRLLANKIHRFLPISNSSEKFLTELLGVRNQQCEIVHLGVDLDTKSYSKTFDLEFRSQYRLQNTKILVNAGKQYAGKNILFLLDLYEQILIKIKSEVALVLVGEAVGGYELQIEAKIHEISKEHKMCRILRLPFMKNSDLNKVYSAADLGIWPGIASNTIQEAMACGAVVALLDSGITSQLIVDDSLLIKELDPEVISDQLLPLVDDDAKLEEMKLRTSVLINSFSWQKIAEKTLISYET